MLWITRLGLKPAVSPTALLAPPEVVPAGTAAPFTDAAFDVGSGGGGLEGGGGGGSSGGGGGGSAFLRGDLGLVAAISAAAAAFGACIK